MNSKRGLSLIVLVVFSFTIVAILVTAGVKIIQLTNLVEVEEKNSLVNVNYKSIVDEKSFADFSVYCEKIGDIGLVIIDSEYTGQVMYTCLEVEDGVVPNVGTASWSYDTQFEIRKSGQYLIYAKDQLGNISDSYIMYVEL